MQRKQNSRNGPEQGARAISPRTPANLPPGRPEGPAWSSGRAHANPNEPQGRLTRKNNRRKHRRAPVQAGTIAALNESKLGTIADISPGGLAFRYIGFDKEEEDFFISEVKQVSIVNNAGFAMHNMPCKIIEIETSPPEYPFSAVRTMQCRLQFIHLTPEQEMQLEYFITHFQEQGSV